MTEIDGKLWAAFELFAEKYPDDPGARMTLELARWVREHQSLLEKADRDPPKPKVVPSKPPRFPS